MCLDSDTVVLRHMERFCVETAPGQAPGILCPLSAVEGGYHALITRLIMH